MLDRLTIAQKLAVIGFAFLVPLALTTFFLVDEKRIKIEFAEHELIGIEYMRPLAQLQIGLVRHELDTAANRVDADPAREIENDKAIDDALARVVEVDRRLGPQLGMTAAQLALRGRASSSPVELERRWRSRTPLDETELVQALIADVSTLITQVGDSSGLILDPDLDSYYVSNAVVSGESQLVSLLGVLSQELRSVKDRGNLARAERVAIVTTLAELNAASSAVHDSIESAIVGAATFSNDEQVKITLAPHEQASTRTMAELQSLIGKHLVENTPPIDEAVLTAVDRSFEANRRLWTALIEQDASLIEMRRDRDLARRWFALVSVLLALAATALLVVYVIRSITRPLATALQVSERLAQGEIPQPFDVPSTSGETARLLHSLNDVLKFLHTSMRTITANDRLTSLGTLAAGVAHEINNPLAFVMGNLEVVLERMRDGRIGSSQAVLDLRSPLEDALTGARRIKKTVRDMRVFSRVDEERRVALDVHAVLDLTLSMTSNDIRHRAKLVKDYGETPCVEADEARLGQVFINLVINATHAIPIGHADEHEIRLVTRTSPAGEAVVEIQDTGTGIALEDLPRIFDPFFTTRPVGQGTGLGLAICHGIVSALGGTIVAENRERGAVFRVTLPPAPPHAALPAPSEPARIASKQRRHILIVDDDRLVGTAIQRSLDEHDVEIVSEASAALSRLERGERFDAIVCDVMMPKMSGMEFHAAVARISSEQRDRIVFMTGGAFTNAARTFLEHVPNARLEKPFPADSLRTTLEQLLA